MRTVIRTLSTVMILVCLLSLVGCFGGMNNTGNSIPEATVHQRMLDGTALTQEQRIINREVSCAKLPKTVDDIITTCSKKNSPYTITGVEKQMAPVTKCAGDKGLNNYHVNQTDLQMCLLDNIIENMDYTSTINGVPLNQLSDAVKVQEQYDSMEGLTVEQRNAMVAGMCNQYSRNDINSLDYCIVRHTPNNINEMSYEEGSKVSKKINECVKNSGVLDGMADSEGQRFTNCLRTRFMVYSISLK